MLVFGQIVAEKDQIKIKEGPEQIKHYENINGSHPCWAKKGQKQVDKIIYWPK